MEVLFDSNDTSAWHLLWFRRKVLLPAANVNESPENIFIRSNLGYTLRFKIPTAPVVVGSGILCYTTRRKDDNQ